MKFGPRWGRRFQIFPNQDPTKRLYLGLLWREATCRSVVTTALPLNHFHWFIGHDIVIRNLLHLFPGHILVSQFETSKLSWHPQIYTNFDSLLTLQHTLLTLHWQFNTKYKDSSFCRPHSIWLAEITAQKHLKADWRVPLPLLSWAMRAFRPTVTTVKVFHSCSLWRVCCLEIPCDQIRLL